jgi:ABC-type multidrug transport system fused ATPase/permease subunit
MTLATTLRSMLHVVARERHWVGLAKALPLTLAALALGLLQPLLVKHVVDVVDAGRRLWPAVAGVMAVFAAQALLRATAQVMFAQTGETVMLHVRQRLVARMLRLDMSEYQQQRLGDLIARATSDPLLLRQVIGEAAAGAVTGTLGLVGTVALMVWLDWLLALVVAALITVSLAAVLPSLAGIRAASAARQRAVGDLAADLDRALGAIRTVRASRAEPRETSRLNDQAAVAYTAGIRMAKREALLVPATDLAVTGSLLAALLVGGIRVANGATTVGDLVAFVLYLFSLTVPVGALFDSISATQQASGALARINQTLALPLEDNIDTEPGRHPPQPPGVIATPPAETHATPPTAPGPLLELRDVWFAYQTGQPVLRGVSFAVPSRGHVVLVGPSGAGKSTIFGLIEGFWTPQHGQILLDGHDLATVTRTKLRATIGLVDQDCPLLHGTLRDNLYYAAPTASDHEVRRALELVNLADLVAALPHGLDTEVGERGVKLSAGQRQRLAFARALLPQPPLLLLDEPTAHLDHANETAVLNSVTDLARDCALLVASHRPSTIDAAHHVVVLDHGTVIDAGIHDELLKTSRHYQQMMSDNHRRPKHVEATGTVSFPV